MTITTITATSLADLKGASTSNPSIVYDRSLWTWTTGDSTGQADDINVVKANSTALTVGAWARQGASGIAFKQAGAGAITRSQEARNRDTLSVKDFGTFGDGTAADAAFAAARAAALTFNIKRIIIPAGAYLLTGFDLSVPGMIWEGDGESTRLIANGTNANALLVSGDRVTLRGVKLDGNGTSTSSTNGCGVRLTADGFLGEDLWFDGFAWDVSALIATAKRGPRLIRTRHRNNVGIGTGVSRVGGHSIFLGGPFQGTVIEDIDAVSGGNSDRAVLIFNNGSAAWQGAQVTRGWYEGHLLGGVSASDEDSDGSDRAFGFTIQGGYYKNIPKAAIKAKLSKGIRVQGAVIDSCGGTPENALSGLFGSILINSIGQMDVSHCTLRNNGDAGIVFNGNDPWPKSRPGDGFGLASITCADNIIEGCGLVSPTYGSGIVHLGRVKSVDIHHNSVRRVTRYGAFVDGADAQGRRAVQSLRLYANTIVDSPANEYYPISVRNVAVVQQDGNLCANFKGIVANYEKCDTVDIGAADNLGNSAVSAAPVIILSAVDTLMFAGRAGCTFYPAWATGTAYVIGDRANNGGEVYEAIFAGTSAASGTGPSGTNPATLFVDNSVSWAWVAGYRKNNAGIQLSPGTTTAIIADSARFEGLVGPAISGGGAVPSNLMRSRIQGGTVTLVAGSASVTLLQGENDTNYKVQLQGTQGGSYGVGSKSGTQFTINGPAGSTDTVQYRVWR